MTPSPDKPRSRRKFREFPHIGWREWVSLPDLGVDFIKAKIDTGARTSSIHAYEIEPFERDGEQYVRFELHPVQRNTKETIRTEAKLLEYRRVTSSNGHQSSRPVIVTNVRLLDQVWPIELTLANRDTMGFRMLLGRESIRDRFLIDAGRSHLGGVPEAMRKSPSKKKSPKPSDKKSS
ncbi:ATP-dependent zinc protease family protein [Thalassoroseus pseudoceratinae]|uniref:ATP-dependent zinc protease family protein n=1 Tax=Thalassoroseus pseudoceratinae TaxID=2713176 RepID=UPI00141E7694|nr:ATP-dependent zinc protease [Thalassoroseus pseudoceratinae]